MSPTVRKRTETSSTVSPARAGVSGDGNDQAAAPHHRAPVRVVDGGHFQLLARDVLPHVELGPVGDREHAHVLARVHARVVQVPQLRALVASGPTGRTRRGTRTRAPWRAPFPRRAARRRSRRRSRTRRSPRAASPTAPRCGFVPWRASRTVPRSIESSTERTISRSPSSAARASRNAITSAKVVPGVDVQQREREAPRAERLLRQAQQDDRILAAGEEQHRVLATRPRPRAGCRSPPTRASRGGCAQPAWAISRLARVQIRIPCARRFPTTSARRAGLRPPPPAACRARSRSSGSPGRRAGCRAPRACGCSPRRRPRSSRRAD